MTQIKICGLKRVEDTVAAAEAGADFLGFVFARSRRRVEPEMVREMTDEARRSSPCAMVGVFVNEEPGEMNRIARLSGLDYIQLSGDEPDDIVDALDLPAIQVIHVGPSVDPLALASRVSDSQAELILLDTAEAGSHGGTGRVFDWSLVQALDRPVLLAGGLDSHNVAAAIRAVRPWGLDVSTGVETDGEKDRDKIREFIRAARGA